MLLVLCSRQICHTDLTLELSPASFVPALTSDARSAEYSHILAVASNHGKNVAPRVAVKLDAAPISDVTAIKGEDTFERPMYAGEFNAAALLYTLDRGQKAWVGAFMALSHPIWSHCCLCSPAVSGPLQAMPLRLSSRLTLSRS